MNFYWLEFCLKSFYELHMGYLKKMASLSFVLIKSI